MALPRHLSSLLFLGLLLTGCYGGCHGGLSSAEISQPNTKPPEAVIRSVARTWPGARIASAERIYDLSLDPQFWGDYRLALELPGKPAQIYSILGADGKIKQHGGFLEDPLMQTAGQRALTLRDRAH